MLKKIKNKILIRVLLAILLIVFVGVEADYFIDYNKSGLSNFNIENYSNPVLYNQKFTAEIKATGDANSLQFLAVPPKIEGGEDVVLSFYINDKTVPVLSKILTEKEIFSGQYIIVPLPEEINKGTECFFELTSTETDPEKAVRVVFGSAEKSDVLQWFCENDIQPGIPGVSLVYRTVKITAAAIAFISLLLIVFSIIIIIVNNKKSLLSMFTGAMEPVVASALIIVALYLIEMLQEANILSFDKLVIFANILIVSGIALLLNAFVNRFISSVSLAVIICLAFGIANHFLILFRGTTLLPSDLLGISTAIKVAESYKFEFSTSVICAVCIIIAATSLLGLGKKNNTVKLPENKIFRYSARLISAVFAGLMMITLATKPGLLNGEIQLWRQAAGSRLMNGFLFNFSMNIPLLVHEKPENYDVSELDTYTDFDAEPANTNNAKMTKEELPNILFIMNESFADPRTVLDIKDADILLPVLDKLKNNEEAFVGQTAVSVFGGGTSCSEYEALTGFSVRTDNANGAPYLTYFNNNTPSFVWHMKNLGYTTTSLHLASSINWYRGTAYPNMGFDQMIFVNDGTAEIEDSIDMFEGEYISAAGNQFNTFPADKVGYDLVIRLLKEYDDPLFNFHITMQNHGAYPDTDVEYDVETDDWSVYLKLMNLSDAQLGDFLDYLSDFEEPTVVVFFGDHWSYYDENRLCAAGVSMAEMTSKQLTDYYSTPYIVWSNCGYDFSSLPEQTSLPYLTSLVLNQIGVDLSPWQKFLVHWSEKVPVYSTYNVISNVDEAGLAEFEYQLQCLHYNALNDKYNRDYDIFGKVG